MSALGQLRGKIGTGGLVIAAIVATALIFVLASAWQDLAPSQVDTATGSSFTCTVLGVYDGDGPINCSEEDVEGKQVRVRLRGIEAREPDNSCQTEACPPMSGRDAKRALERLAVGRLQCTSFGPSYDRVDASCVNPSGTDISCELIRIGAAVRWPEYDREGRLANCAPGRR